MNLGMDFGSTYSICSSYRVDQEKLESVEHNGSVPIPSVIALGKTKNIKIGNLAKKKTGAAGVKTYKAFKMLLMEKNKHLISRHGYDDECTPQWAAREFLSRVVQEAQKNFNDSTVEQLVVGAPNVWFHQFETLSSRAVVRDICSSIEGVQNVRIVSEPVLASAYFAYNYEKNSGSNKPFDGSILIIDYGGGTLDLSLTQIKNNGDKSAEIKMLESNGAGENTDNSIGNAGIVYMEKLMEYVIHKNTPEDADELIGTPEFDKAVNALEDELINEGEDIETTIEDIGIDELDDLEDEVMGDPIECGDNEYEITYADIVKVYDEVIRPVFAQKMDEMICLAKEKQGIDVFKITTDSFRIGIVGGFGKFYLVRKQVRDKFQLFDRLHDVRENNIINNEQDRERAISYGAALVAAGVFGIRNTAPYSFGIVKSNDSVDFMVRCHDDINLDEPYYITMAAGQNKRINKPIALGSKWYKEFRIDYGRTDSKQIRFTPKPQFVEKLKGIVKNKHKTCYLGVSFSGSDVLSFHVREYFYDEGKAAKDETVIELGKLEDSFDKIK